MTLGYTSYYVAQSGPWGGTYGGSGSGYGSGFSGYGNSGYGFTNYGGFTPAPQTTISPNYGTQAPPPATGNTEAVTQSATRAPQSVQTPNFDWNFNTPTFSPGLTPSLPAGTTEAVTVNANPTPQQIGSPNLNWNFNTPNFTPAQLMTPDLPSGTTEAVTVNAPPDPRQVQPPTFSPAFGNPPITPNQFPLPSIPPWAPANQTQPRKTSQPAGSSGGLPQPKLPQAPTPAKPTGITPAQQAALNAMTAQQLANLLKNGNLTPDQAAAVQQTLAAKNAAAQRVAAAGGTAAQQAAAAKAAGLPASPLQPAALVVPLIIAAGVATAWGLTHRQQVATHYRAAVRRVRRITH